MEIIINAADAGGAAADDLAGDGIQCSKHPSSNNVSDGGICALCLQDKLGKLVKSSSTSFSIGSASPSFRSDPAAAAIATSGSLSLLPAVAAAASAASSSSRQFLQNANTGPAKPAHTGRRAHLPFLFGHKKKEKVTAERGGFWSFFYHTKPKTTSVTEAVNSGQKQNGVVQQAQSEVPATTSFGRKAMSRSRSVGCGSRSFSGDFFERISTGFGGCTLRRVESQREGKRASTSSVRSGAGDAIKERVRCGGIFSGFMMTSSSSSSSSSFRISSSTASEEANTEKASSEAAPALAPAAQVRSRSRRWAFASPLRVFGKPSPKEVKTTTIKANPTPNFAAIPSLLTARG